MDRVQKQALLNDLEKKMVLIVGPRQAGKTWIANHIAQDFPHSVYLNYDRLSDRNIMLAHSWLPSTDLLILDELHKMPDWKNYLKGLYDTKPQCMRLIVTGSARLDVYDQMGDSLAGRYYRHRLLPLSIAELSQTQAPEASPHLSLEHLIEHSGFPEPFLIKDPIEVKRWRQQYINSLLSTDIFEFDRVQNLKAMQLIFNLLRERVASPISYQSIADDVAVSPSTVKKYIQILEALYIVFRITPYSKNIARSLLKEPKIYFFDTGLVKGNAGVKLENLVATCLLKHVYGKVDYLAQECALHYLRTKDGLEVDFALSHEGKLTQLIEVKYAESQPAKTLIAFHQRYHVPGIQLVQQLRQPYQTQGIQILDAQHYLSTLYL